MIVLISPTSSPSVDGAGEFSLLEGYEVLAVSPLLCVDLEVEPTLSKLLCDLLPLTLGVLEGLGNEDPATRGKDTVGFPDPVPPSVPHQRLRADKGIHRCL